MSAQGVNLGSALAAGAAASARTSFELRFNQIQNTVIRRLNDEIANANRIPRTLERRVEGLQEENEDLAKAMPVLDQYRVGVQNIMSNVEKFRTQIATLIETLGSDNAVTQEEVDSFNQTKSALRETLNNLPIFKYEGIQDGNVIERLKQEVAGLDAMNPVVGTLEENQDIAFGLLDLDDKAGTAQQVMLTTLTTVVNLEQDMQAELALNQAEIEEVNTVEQAKKVQKVEDLKERYGQLLQALSLSFEASQDFVSTLNSYLSPRVPPKGSVLNLFS